MQSEFSITVGEKYRRDVYQNDKTQTSILTFEIDTNDSIHVC